MSGDRTESLASEQDGENPYAPPQSQPDHQRERLATLAAGYFMFPVSVAIMAFCGLCMVLLPSLVMFLGFALPLSLEAAFLFIDFMVLGTSALYRIWSALAAVWCGIVVMRLSRPLYGLGAGVAAFVPVVNLIVYFILWKKLAKVLTAEGYDAGWWTAEKPVTEDQPAIP